ncbi:MAG: VanW family protein [Bacillota bacterium]
MRPYLRLLATGVVFLWLTRAPWPAGAREHVDRLLCGVHPGVRLEGALVSGYLAPEVQGVLGRWARLRDQDPVDATIRQGTGEILPERPGRILDIPATLEQVIAARESQAVTAVVRPVKPRWTRADLEAISQVIAEFSTWVGGSEERARNVALAASILGHTLVLPGEVFSFNEALGPATLERGFLSAPVMLEDELVMGPGGGVCQVSSTLYNAALQAGLTVRERHPHTQRVGYVPEGRDAAVARGYKDLKIQNPGPYPVVFMLEVTGRNLRACILGQAPGDSTAKRR